jgi:hypothetical protein
MAVNCESVLLGPFEHFSLKLSRTVPTILEAALPYCGPFSRSEVP